MFSLLAAKERTRENCRCFDLLPSYGSAVKICGSCDFFPFDFLLWGFVGAGHCPALSFAATKKLRVTHPKGFLLRGKLSPQVTDEGATAGNFPLIRRASAPPSPLGEGFFSAGKVALFYIVLYNNVSA